MNKFQEELSKNLAELNLIAEKLIEKESVSKLDLDLLTSKLRELYQDLVLFDESNKEVSLQSEPVEIKKEDKEEIKEFILSVVKDTINESLKNELGNILTKYEVEKIFDKKTESLSKMIIAENKVISAEIKEEIEDKIEEVQENNNIIEEELFTKQKEVPIKIEDNFIKQEEVFVKDEENKVEEKEITIEETKKEETPSVLKYLNEQMPKVMEVSPASIAEKYEGQKSIFENISSNVKTNDISSRFAAQNIDLRTSIGVNEKFMFINDLFSGNLREYNEFIQTINQVGSIEEIEEILEKIRIDKKWIVSSLSYTTLREIINKKFC